MFRIRDMPLLRSLIFNFDNQAINILAPTELQTMCDFLSHASCCLFSLRRLCVLRVSAVNLTLKSFCETSDALSMVWLDE